MSGKCYKILVFNELSVAQRIEYQLIIIFLSGGIVKGGVCLVVIAPFDTDGQRPLFISRGARKFTFVYKNICNLNINCVALRKITKVMKCFLLYDNGKLAAIGLFSSLYSCFTEFLYKERFRPAKRCDCAVFISDISDKCLDALLNSGEYYSFLDVRKNLVFMIRQGYLEVLSKYINLNYKTYLNI